MNRASRINPNLDNFGIMVSLICAIHCAALPLLFMVSAYLSIQLKGLEQLELPLFILAGCIGSISIFRTYRSLRVIKPLILLFSGLVLIVLGGVTAQDWQEIFLRVLGSALILVSHILNKKLIKLSSK